jgi:tetratricopeptide (TPR) repeat protein
MHNGDEHFAYLEQAILLFRQCEDWGRLVIALSKFGNSILLNGDVGLAQQRLDEALRLSNQMNNKDAKAVLLSSLGRTSMVRGEYGQAHRYLRAALALWEDLGTRMLVLWSKSFLGYLALYEGNLTEARSIFTDTAREFYNDKSEIGVAFTLEGVAGLCNAEGKPERATRLIGWADATREKISDNRPLLEQADVEKIIAACIARMGKTAFSDVYKEGKKLSLDAAVVYALRES